MIGVFGLLGTLLLVALAITLLLQLYYHIPVFGKLALYKSKSSYKNGVPEPVSIIIAARNEYRNLERNLKSILEQDYPEYEVIVVNDCSWDESQHLLEYYQDVYPHLKISKLIEQEKYPTGKKFALTIGIKAAKYEKLLFTDADCKPASNRWLYHIQDQLHDRNELVLGYSPYEKSGGFLNAFIRWENVMTACFYLSRAIARKAYMGVGRNMAYTKSLFFKQKGFNGHQHILSGDDDLFVNKAANANNTAIQIHPESFMYTVPKKSFTEWVRQKTRHISTGKYYKSSDTFFLGLYYISLFAFYSLFISLLFFPDPLWKFALYAYGIRFLTQCIIFYLCLKKLQQVSLIWFLPLFDFLYLAYLLIFGIRGFFSRQRIYW